MLAECRGYVLVKRERGGVAGDLQTDRLDRKTDRALIGLLAECRGYVVVVVAEEEAAEEEEVVGLQGLSHTLLSAPLLSL